MERRRFIAICGTAGVAGFAGCTGDGGSGDATDVPNTDAEPTTTTRPVPTETDAGRVEGSWPMAGHDPQHTGHAPNERGPVENPVTLWSPRLDQDRRILTSGLAGEPAIEGGTLFLAGSGGGVYAFDATTGEQLWSKSTNFYIESSPAIGDGQLFVGAGDNKVHAFDLASGNRTWATEFESSVDTSVVYASDRVLAYPAYGPLSALDPPDGDTVWTYDSASGVAPAVADGVVYLPAGGYVATIDLATGDSIGSLEISADSIQTAPVIDGRRFYVADEAGTVYGVSLDGLAVEWEATRAAPASATPAVADGRLFVGDADGTVYGLSSEDGTEQWTFDAGDQVTGLSVSGELLYVGATQDEAGRVHALDPTTGSDAWSIGTEAAVTNRPVAVGGVVYVGDGSGALRAFVDESERDAYVTVTETTRTTTESELGDVFSVAVGVYGEEMFGPQTVTVEVGDEVRWVWESDGHNVRPSTENGEWSGTAGGDDTLYDRGHTYSHTFTQPGEYDYYCANHEDMTGTIIVE